MHIHVPGLPQQQGSKRAFVVKGRAIMSDTNEKNLKPWRAAVASAGEEARGEEPLLLGAVKLRVCFAYPRPKSHYRTNGEVKPNAPLYKTSKPDLDKLQRAVGDALTGVVFRDDSQVANWSVIKVYADSAFTDIEVSDLSGGSTDDGRRHHDLEGGSDSDPRDSAAHGGVS